MFRLSKRFHFSAAHRLLGLPDGHPCGTLHGHNYVAELALESLSLDARGFAQIDYHELAPVKAWIDAHWDHNAILSAEDPLNGGESTYLIDSNPSAECLARELFRVAEGLVGNLGARLVSVRISETPDTWAEYSE
jgi:6-pyruvoyltetrahydropterin/6-carboxytetrahydropterin synthase